MNLKITKQQWDNPVIKKMTASKQRYEDMYDLGRMALVDWDNLKLILQILNEKGAFLHGYLSYSRPLSILMLVFQLLASSLEKTLKVILISIEVFNLREHKNHKLRDLYALLPDKISQYPENPEASAIYVKPLLENLGFSTKKPWADMLDLDSVHLRYESSPHDFDIEIQISSILEIHSELTHLIMELLNMANNAAKKNLSSKDLESCLKDQKPILTYFESRPTNGNLLTGITGIEKIRISTKSIDSKVAKSAESL